MITEHTALFLILLAAIVEPFLPVGAILLSIEPVVFTPNLLSNWPSLEQQAVGLAVLSLVRHIFSENDGTAEVRSSQLTHVIRTSE